MTRVEIDPNVRTRGNWTFSGLEDADGPVTVGEIVHVFEPESGLEGSGRVEDVDEARRVIFLSVDWASLSIPPAALSVQDLAAYGIRASFSVCHGGTTAAVHNVSAVPTQVAAVSAVPCPL